MKTSIRICCMGLLMLISALNANAQRTFIFINQTNQDIWVGAQGNPLPANGGFALPVGAQRTITVPVASSAIRFWGRTGCRTGADGVWRCETGDCAQGTVECRGAGGIPPVTLAEFTLDAANAGNQDFYDVSLVDGYNLPMRIIPVPGTFSPRNTSKYECGIAGCTSDLNPSCPTDLRVTNSSGQVVACLSACMKYNTDQYCCRNAYGTPQTCPPTSYSQIFKNACPDAYSYAYDDETSTYLCVGATYQIVFGTGGTPPPPTTGVATLYKDCNFGGTAVGLPTGDYTLAQLNSRGIANDDVSSIRVNSGYGVQIFQNDNFTGTSYTITGEDNCLVDNGINDWISSLRVRAAAGSFNQTVQAESYSAMAGVQTETTTDAGGGQNVGWIETGDWMSYSGINIPSTGSYRVEYRVASPNSTGRLSLDLNGGATVLGALGIPATGGWQNWTTISHNVNINSGTYNFGIFAAAGGWNINWWRISRVSSARLGITKDGDWETLTIYPSLVEKTLKLELLSGIKEAKFKVINQEGAEVSKGSLLSDNLDVSNLPAGVYTIIITKDGKVNKGRFIKK